MLNVKVLGTPTIRRSDGTPVRLQSRKQTGVLLYLALEGREQPVQRDRLMELFWPDVARERAYQSLCQAVTEIRVVLGRDAVAATGDALMLTMPVVSELDRLAEDLERLDLAHPLEGVDWWGGPALGHWLEACRTRIRRLAEDQLREGIERFRRLGVTPRVHRCGALLYELDPFSEPAVLALADEHLLRGDVVGAIRLLRAHLGRLSDTLGCRPQPNVERLLRRLEVGAHPPVELVPRRLAAMAPQVRPPVLVARERELAHLEGEWQRVRGDREVRTCLVTGPGGIGKSTLVRRFAASVAARAQPVFVVSCQEIGEGIPFAATSDLVAALLLDPAVSATDPAWLAEVSRVYPALRDRYPGVPEPGETPPETVRVRVAEGLAHMLEAVAEGYPVAVLFDDMHNMDPTSRGVLHMLLRRAEALPLLLVGTARARTLEQGLASGAPEGDAVAWGSTLRLGPLDREGSRTLVSTLAPALQLDAPRVADRIVELSEGNPHFIEMLLSDWERHATASLAAGLSTDQLPKDWQPPDSLRQAFVRLYDGLGTLAQHVLHVLAVAQRALTAEEVAEALGQTPVELDAAALELLSRGILRLDGGALCFKNELHRAYAYFALAAEVRKYFHAKLGRAMRRLAGAADFRRTLEAGHHLLGAGDNAQATSLILGAAKRAVDAGASVEAEEALQELLPVDPLPERSEVLLALAVAQIHRRKPRDAISTLGLLDAEGCSDEVLIQESLLRLRANVMLRTASAGGLAKRAQAALTKALATGATDISLEALQLAAELAAEEGDLQRLDDLGLVCQRLSGADLNTRQLAQGAVCQGFIHLAGGHYEQAAGVFMNGISALGDNSSALPALWRLLNGLGMSLTGTGEYESAIRVFRRILATTHGVSTSPSPLLWSNIAVCYQEQGLAVSAAEHFARALHALRRSPDPKAGVTVMAAAGSFAIDLGQMETADRCIRLAERTAADFETSIEPLDTWLIRADYLLAAEETEFAWRLVRDRVLPLGERLYVMGEAARHERIMRHYKLATYGVDTYKAFRDSRGSFESMLPLHGRAELACFHDWAVRVETEGDSPSGIEEAVQAGLGGTLLHLEAMRTLPPLKRTDSARQNFNEPLVVASFPSLFREGLPATLDWHLPEF